MNKETQQRIAHELEYAKYVNEYNIDHIINRIGKERIVNSKCEHFNDIPLEEWDAIGIPTTTLSQQVCAAKACAREIQRRGM